MTEWIVKYWLEVAFGIIVTIGGLCWKKAIQMIKVDKSRQEEEFYARLNEKIGQKIDESYAQSKKDDEFLQAEINDISVSLDGLKRGVLSIQGRAFKSACRDCLQPDHTITQEDYENLMADHDAYNHLGGNHDGDKLWAAVTQKYYNHL